MLIPVNEIYLLTPEQLSPAIPSFDSLYEDGVRVNPIPIKLKMSEVHVDDSKGNTARENGTNPAAVEELRQSIAKGWQTNEFLPAVRRLKSSSGYKWELVYGFTRVEAIELLHGSDIELYFTEIVCDEYTIRSIRSIENEGLPKKMNKETDLKHTLIQEIESGVLKNTERDIMNWMNKVCPHRTEQSKKKIFAMVEEAVNTPTKFELYTEAKALRWVRNYSDVNYVFGGALVDNTHTFLCRSGYQYRTYHRMLKRHLKTGLSCQVVFHVESPTTKSNLAKRRLKVMEEWNDGLNNLKAIGADVSFMKVAGFLPQAKELEPWGKLIQVAVPSKNSKNPLPIGNYNDVDDEDEDFEEAA